MTTLKFESEEERQLMMIGLESITVPWTLKDSVQKFETQKLVIKLHRCCQKAEITPPEPDQP